MADKVIFLLSGTSWTVPADWDSANNHIEMIDGGGALSDAGGGVAVGSIGGSYRRYNNVTLTPGASASYAIGAGASYGTSTGGATSHTGCSSPAVTNAGGAGNVNGDNITYGYGGGAGGPSGAGGAATDTAGGTNGGGSWTSTHNAAGGTSVASAAPGDGGGAGGAYGGASGGTTIDGGSNPNGAPGIIVVTYTPILPITGTLAASEAKDTFAGSGTVQDAIFGTLAATEAKDGFAATGTAGNVGTLAATEAPDTFAADGTVSAASIFGTLAASEASDAFAATGTVSDEVINPGGCWPLLDENGFPLLDEFGLPLYDEFGCDGTHPNRNDGTYGGQDRIARAFARAAHARKLRRIRDEANKLPAPAILDVAATLSAEQQEAARFAKAREERMQNLARQMSQERDQARRQAAAAEAGRQNIKVKETKPAPVVVDPQAMEKELARQRAHADRKDGERAIEVYVGTLAKHIVSYHLTRK